jgi:methyl-accepting chemotaxis protein
MASWRAAREFFAYHGIWAFGVRTMRLWSLRMKMVLLVTVMALPLLPLMVGEIAERNRIATANAQRIAGLDVADAAYALAIKLDRQSQALETGQALLAGQAAVEQQALVDRIAAAVALGLPIDAMARSQMPMLERVAALESVSGSSRLDLLGQARRALGSLRQVALDSSGALLSENPRLALQAELSLQHLPAMHRGLSTLRGLAVQQAALLDQTPRPAAGLHAVVLLAAGSSADLSRVLQLSERAQGALVGAESDAAGRAFDAVRAVQASVRTGMLAAEPTVDLPALRRQVEQASDNLSTLQQSGSAALKTRLLVLQRAAETQRQWLFGALAGTVLLAAYLIYSFFLVMRGGLASLNHQMNRLAQGDLSARPMARGGDEVADTMHAMTVSLAKLSDLLAAIRQGVGAITQASEQIADGNADLSDRSRRSADGLEQLLAGVARYTEQVQTFSARLE